MIQSSRRVVQCRTPVVWRLFADRDDAQLSELRRKVRRRLRAGRSGDAIVAGISDAWVAARIAWEIVPDPSTAIALSEQAGHGGHALFLAARAGQVEQVATLAERQMRSEKETRRKVAAAVLLGEALLTLGERERAVEALLPAQLFADESRRLEEILGVVGAVGDLRKEAAAMLSAAETARAADAQLLRLRAAWLLHLHGAPLDEFAALLPARDDEATDWLRERCLTTAARWDELYADQQRRLGEAEHPVERAALARGFAWSWRARAPFDGSKAARFLVEAVTPAQSDLPAVLALARRVAIESGDWNVLQSVAEKAAPLDDEDRALAAGAIEEARAAQPRAPTNEGNLEAVKKLIAADPRARAPRRELAQLLRKAEKWRVLVEALREEEATACATPAERAAVLREIVVVGRDQLKHEPLVTTSLNEILQHSPDDEAALEQLAALHGQNKRWAELAAIWSARAARVDDPDEAAALWLKVAKLQLEHLNNEPEAVKQLEQVLGLAADPAAMQLLDGLYNKRREWEKLVGLGRRRMAQEADPALRLTQSLELARLAERVKKPALSIECWEQVLQLQPGEPEALAALEKLYERERRFGELAEVCARQAQATVDPVRQAAAWQKLGQLYSERLDEPERAIDAWRKLLALQPDSVRAYDALRKLLVARRAWDELEQLFGARLDEYLRTLERQVELEPPPVQLELLSRMAAIFRDRLNRPERALRVLERMLEIEPRNLGAAEGLIPLYGSADSPKLIRVLAIQLEHTGDPTTRQARLKRLAELDEQAGDLLGAFQWRLTALAEDPTGTRESLERLAEVTSKWRELVDTYRTATARLSGTASLPLLRVVARAEEEQLADAESAVSTWRRILEIDFLNEEALEALERLYTGREQHAELIVICQRRMQLATDLETRKRVHLKIAHLAEQRLHDDTLAISAFAALWEEDPHEKAAFEALDRLYRKTGKWRSLADVVERQLLLQPDDNELRLSLAELRETWLGDGAGAIALYQRVLEHEPSSAVARAALERQLSGEYKSQAATILVPIYEQAGEWARLAEAHELLAASLEGEALVDHLRTLGRIREEQLGDAAGALDAFTRALRAAPADLALYARLEKLAESLDAWPKLVTLYREIASRPLALPVQIEVRCRLGRLYRDRLNDIEGAIATFQRVVDLDANNDEAEIALEHLYEQTGRKQELADVLRRRLSSVESLAERVQVATRLVAALGGDDETLRALEKALAERPDDPRRVRGLAELLTARAAADPASSQARAIELWDKLVRLEPGGTRAFDALFELHQAAGRYAEAEAALVRRAPSGETWARLYRLRADRLNDPTGARAALASAVEQGALDAPSLGLDERARLAQAWAEASLADESDDVEQIRRWRRVLELDPACDAAREALETLYRRGEKWPELVSLLKQKLPRLDDKALRIAVWLEIDRICDAELGDAEAAYQALCAAYREDPDDEAIASELERRATTPERWRAATREMLRVAERVEAVDPRAAVDRWVKIARVYDDQLESLDEAALILRGVLATDPDHRQALELLAGLLQKRGAWGEMVPLLYHRAEVEHDPVTRVAMFLSVADMLEVQEGDALGAIKAYQHVLGADPQNAQARYALENLYRRTEKWAEQLDLLAARVKDTEDAAEKLACLLEMGEILDERIGDVEQAAAVFRQVLEIDPMSIDALEGLERLYRAAGDYEGELTILEHELQLWPDHADYVYGKMEGALRDAGKWERLVEILGEHVRTVEDAGRRLELRCAMGEVYEELKDATKAREAYAEVLLEQPDDERALDGLARLSKE
jgi:tetratricopeptide (TPR) repeat protein